MSATRHGDALFHTVPMYSSLVSVVSSSCNHLYMKTGGSGTFKYTYIRKRIFTQRPYRIMVICIRTYRLPTACKAYSQAFSDRRICVGIRLCCLIGKIDSSHFFWLIACKNKHISFNHLSFSIYCLYQHFGAETILKLSRQFWYKNMATKSKLEGREFDSSLPKLFSSKTVHKKNLRFLRCFIFSNVRKSI